MGIPSSGDSVQWGFRVVICTSYEISELISGLENSKASDIPIKIIKRSSHIISPLLASHFNDTMSKGIFPDILKVGKITPIYKKDNPELLENYRPVSTLSMKTGKEQRVLMIRQVTFTCIKNTGATGSLLSMLLQLQRPALTTKGSISIQVILKKHGA